MVQPPTRHSPAHHQHARERSAKSMPQPVTYLFKSPIKHQNELIYDIQVRPPVMRDLKALNGIVGTFTRAGKMIRAPDRFDRERGGRDLARGHSRAGEIGSPFSLLIGSLQRPRRRVSAALPLAAFGDRRSDGGRAEVLERRRGRCRAPYEKGNESANSANQD